MSDKERMRLGAIILAGGRSVRMGRPKESLPFGDDTLLGRACRTLAACCAPIVVIARDERQALPSLPADVTVQLDTAPGEGPLPALEHGLRWLADTHAFTTSDAALLTGCDLPFLTAQVVRNLASALGDGVLVMPRTQDGLHPLAAIYRVAVRTAVADRLAKGRRSVQDLAALPGARVLDEAAWRAFDPELLALQNVNTPAEYARALARLAPH